MPREDRRIFFDYGETYKAVISLCVQKGMPRPPTGLLLKVENSKGDTGELDFTIESVKSGNIEIIRYTKDFVIAALMIMCRTVNIPLPKGANKSLGLSDKDLVLYVHMLR